MSEPVKILAFAGSTRRDSWNKKLLHIALQGARSAGAQVTLIDLKDFPLPLYDGDLEATAGVPENALQLKELFTSHQGLLLACPEYNSSITAVLKNTLDWVSRPVPNEPPLAAFKGKVVTLISASPGALGGLRGLIHVRAILGNIGCIVLPDQQAVNKASEAFNDAGGLKDEAMQKRIEGLGAQLAQFLIRLA
ncbi:MAG: NAD(P)H-dependent oxidoreductase [Gammaproteobacteria bacterium]